MLLVVSYVDNKLVKFLKLELKFTRTKKNVKNYKKKSYNRTCFVVCISSGSLQQNSKTFKKSPQAT